MPSKLSPAQRDALAHAAAGDGTLRREPGGFWVASVSEHVREPGREWSWSTITQTVRALEARGWLERAGAFAEDWRDTRRLTDAGRAALAS